MGTAKANARNPAIKPSAASNRKRKSVRCVIASILSDGSRRMIRTFQEVVCEDTPAVGIAEGTMNSRRTITFLAFPLMVSCGLLLAGRAARTKVIQASPELQQAQQTPTIEEYQPKSTLVTKEHRVERAKFPFIDIHSHHWNPTPGEVDWLVREMDTINLRVMVNLSGGTGEQLQRTVEAMKGRYPSRFVVFANLSYDDLNTSGYGARAATRLEQDVKSGAQGLKIFKNLGMELKEFPGRARPPAKYPPFETLIAERNHLFAKHPKTNFIAAHLAFHGNDLERLGKLFDAYPNVYVDIAAVLAELGRQPYSAHDFLIKYQDRVLMGKDIYEVNEYKWYFQSLETRDEYFEYYRKRHAFWRIYGFQVPDDVLKKVYYKNALKLVPGIDAKAFPD